VILGSVTELLEDLLGAVPDLERAVLMTKRDIKSSCLREKKGVEREREIMNRRVKLE
jgi:hypothetical protein